jgi:hypothetical protein
VDNSLPSAFVEHAGQRTVIGGDNSVFEFSGFDKALAFAGSAIHYYDLIHFATSAFDTLYVAYLERFTPVVLGALLGRRVCCGHIDCYNQPVEALGFRMQHWVRSCFFFLPPAEAMSLRGFVSLSDSSQLLSGHPEEPFLAEAPLDATYRRYITDWLTGRDIGQGVQWHSSFGLSRATLPTFSRKALCIVNEQVLSARLEAHGCRLVDVTWLSAMLRHRDSAAVPWGTPWRDQLAGRDRDALSVV